MNYTRYSQYKGITLPSAQKSKAKEELESAVGRAHEVLVSATTVFPFTLFPDTVTVDRGKISVAKRAFFRIGEVVSMRIEDILNVTASVGPFFGSITVHTRFFDQHKPYTVNYFWRDDALKIKRIVQGYIIALQKDIDCSVFGTKELAEMLDELGQSQNEEEI